jgi:hypothetical protein
MWFPVHQACMSLALILSLVGLIPMLVEKGVEPLAKGMAHSIVGIIAICLAFVQPVLAFFRCSPGKHFSPAHDFLLPLLVYFKDDISNRHHCYLLGLRPA